MPTADGIQIGQGITTGTSVDITANGTTTLTDGKHQITAAETVSGVNYVTTFNPETITVNTVVPQITSTPVTQATIGSTLNYQVTTNAAATERLTYMLVAAPAGMAISSSGKITWDPAIGTTFPQRVDVRVTDQYGNSTDQIFSIGLYTPFVPKIIVPQPVARNVLHWPL